MKTKRKTRSNTSRATKRTSAKARATVQPKSVAKRVIAQSGERFVKVSAAGALLPKSATEWEGVYDTTTGLIWGRKVLPGEANWKDSLKKAESATLCGAPARAPTVLERFALNDFGRSEPALDTNYFHNDGYVWEWTSTPAASPSGCAWYVNLSYGYCNRSNQSVHNYVRAVRAGQL